MITEGEINSNCKPRAWKIFWSFYRFTNRAQDTRKTVRPPCIETIMFSNYPKHVSVFASVKIILIKNSMRLNCGRSNTHSAARGFIALSRKTITQNSTCNIFTLTREVSCLRTGRTIDNSWPISVEIPLKRNLSCQSTHFCALPDTWVAYHLRLPHREGLTYFYGNSVTRHLAKIDFYLHIRKKSS